MAQNPKKGRHPGYYTRKVVVSNNRFVQWSEKYERNSKSLPSVSIPTNLRAQAGLYGGDCWPYVLHS